MKARAPYAFALMAMALAVYLNHQNNRLRAENAQIRAERDSATLAAEQLWGTINRAAE